MCLPYHVPCCATAQLPEGLRAPLMLHLDDRQTVTDLKRDVVKRLGSLAKEMGIPVPDLSSVRLGEVCCLLFGMDNILPVPVGLPACIILFAPRHFVLCV